jgi:hypothetical protein
MQPQSTYGTYIECRAVSGVNISEDARHWIGLLQYNPSTDADMTLASGKKHIGERDIFENFLLMFLSNSALLKSLVLLFTVLPSTGVQRSVDNH